MNASIRSRAALRSGALVVVAVIFATLSPPMTALAYQGENEVVKGRYYESKGDIAAAEAIYAGIVERQSHPRAVRAAVRRLVVIASSRRDTAAEMHWLEAAVRNGDTNRFSDLARISSDSGRLPPSFREMATAYETAAETQPSTTLANFMAERAEAGDLAGTGVRSTDPMHWYRLAIARGSRGAVSKAIERLLAAGQIDAALKLLATLGPATAGDEAVSIAKQLARGADGAKSRERAAAILKSVGGPAADEAAVTLMREDVAAGNVAGAMFWLSRTGRATKGVASAVARIYEKTEDPAVREKLLAELQRRGAAGDTEALTAAGKLLMAQGGKPTPDIVRLVLATEAQATPEAVDRVARLIGRVPVADPDAAALVETLVTSADQGGAVAMTVLARFYATGGPVAVDPAESRRWTEAAAKAGSAEAQYRLGLTLAMGETADREQSQALLAKAADQGYAPARAALAALVTTTGANP